MMIKTTTSLARNHFIDALRGIAALLVLATHLQASVTGFYPNGWLAAHPAVVATLEHGAIGVDVFFLISGFGDFQESCHSLAAIQAAWIKGSARSGSGSSVGLFIHTSAG